LTLPESLDITPVYFVRLALRDPEGREVSHNFYWLSTRSDVPDWEASNYFTTPLSQAADFTDLNRLPQVDLLINSDTGTHRDEQITRVTVQNSSRHLAFMIRLRLTDAAGNDVLPILWDDNFFSLLPGERREIGAHYDPSLLHGAPVVRVEGWNIVPRSIHSPIDKPLAAAPVH
jgi:exo-1,4-beta-D-glucosaminidase